MANALVQVEAQFDLMPDEPPPPSEEDRRLASGFEANVERIALMLRSGIHDNQIIAMRKTNPDRAAHLAELLGMMQKDPAPDRGGATRDGRAGQFPRY